MNNRKSRTTAGIELVKIENHQDAARKGKQILLVFYGPIKEKEIEEKFAKNYSGKENYYRFKSAVETSLNE